MEWIFEQKVEDCEDLDALIGRLPRGRRFHARSGGDASPSVAVNGHVAFCFACASRTLAPILFVPLTHLLRMHRMYIALSGGTGPLPSRSRNASGNACTRAC